MANEKKEAEKMTREDRVVHEADKAFAALIGCGARLGEQLPTIVRHYTWLKNHAAPNATAEMRGMEYVMDKLGFRFVTKDVEVRVKTNF